MKVLGISGDEQKAFWLILAAIYHLGAAGATKGEIVNPQSFSFDQQNIRYHRIKIFPDFYYTWCACQKEKASGEKYLKIYSSQIHLAASDWLLQSWTLLSAHVCKLIYSKFDRTSVRVTLLALPESYKVPQTQLLARHQSLIVDKHCHISRTKNINLVLAWSSFLSALLSEL